MVERIPITQAGYDKMSEELNRLYKVERPDVIKAIEVAREHGDLKENAEYHAAKERQSFIAGKILELNDKISRAEIIDCSCLDCEMVVFGVVVTLIDLNTDEKLVYQLLGTEEADAECGSISIVSPLGRAILGKVVGDEVDVKTPGGLRLFEIIDIASPE